MVKIKNNEVTLKCNSVEISSLEKMLEREIITAVKIKDKCINNFELFEKLIKIVEEKKISLLKIKSTRFRKQGSTIIANMISRNTSLKSIIITRCSNNGLKKIIKSFNSNSTIEHIKFDNMKLSDEHLELLLQNINRNITYLSLRFNLLTSKSADFIANYLVGNNSLKKLFLAYNSIGNLGCKSIMRTLSKNTTLEIIDIGNNKINGQIELLIANTLIKNKTLTNLYLYDNILNSEIVKIFDALCNNCTLTTLAISNLVSDKVFESIYNTLSLNTTLQNLYLYKSCLSKDNCNILSGAICNNKTLVSFSITDCNIEYGSGFYLSNIVTENAVIQNLSITDNYIQYDELSLIASALEKNSTITNLGLFPAEIFTQIRGEHSQPLQEILVKNLETNYSITNLNLGYTEKLSPDLQAIIDRNKNIANEIRFKKQKSVSY